MSYKLPGSSTTTRRSSHIVGGNGQVFKANPTRTPSSGSMSRSGSSSNVRPTSATISSSRGTRTSSASGYGGPTGAAKSTQQPSKPPKEPTSTTSSMVVGTLRPGLLSSASSSSIASAHPSSSRGTLKAPRMNAFTENTSLGGPTKKQPAPSTEPAAPKDEVESAQRRALIDSFLSNMPKKPSVSTISSASPKPITENSSPELGKPSPTGNVKSPLGTAHSTSQSLDERIRELEQRRARLSSTQHDNNVESAASTEAKKLVPQNALASNARSEDRLPDPISERTSTRRAENPQRPEVTPTTELSRQPFASSVSSSALALSQARAYAERQDAATAQQHANTVKSSPSTVPASTSVGQKQLTLVKNSSTGASKQPQQPPARSAIQLRAIQQQQQKKASSSATTLTTAPAPTALTAEETAAMEGTDLGARKGNHVHHFPTSGYYGCRRCHLPLFSAESKVGVGGGYPAFCRYFVPSLQTAIQMINFEAKITMHCSRCSGFIGHMSQARATTTGGFVQVNSLCVAYLDCPVPPEYAQCEGSYDCTEQEEAEERRAKKERIAQWGTRRPNAVDDDDDDDDGWSASSSEGSQNEDNDFDF